MAQYSLLVFRGNESIGEYRLTAKDEAAVLSALANLKPEFTGVILSSNGICAHSRNLPKDNPWYRNDCVLVSRCVDKR